MAKGDAPPPSNDNSERHQLTNTPPHGELTPAQQEAFAADASSLIARSKRGEQLKPDEINRAVTDLSNLSAEKYSDVVVASFGGRKEQYVSLPTELKDSFKEWVDFFKAQNTHPQSVAMNENILKAITA